MSVILDYFQQKLMKKKLLKVKKTYKLGLFWALFTRFRGNKNFSGKSASVTIYFCYFCTNGRTHGRTDKLEFIMNIRHMSFSAGGPKNKKQTNKKQQQQQNSNNLSKIANLSGSWAVDSDVTAASGYGVSQRFVLCEISTCYHLATSENLQR